MIELRPYQIDLAAKGLEILQRCGLVYLALMPRVGKTFTSLKIAWDFGAKNVLFITKLKAIPSIEDDNSKLTPPFKLTVVNYESVHKLVWNYDLVICDESHVLSMFPKPAARTKILKEKCWNLPIIYLSATPTAESYSQIFHQLWISKRSPFSEYKNFYAWAKDYVDVRKKWIKGFQINDYSHAKDDKVKEAIAPYMLTFSQEEAGFESFVEEEIITVQIDERMYKLMAVLKKDKVYKTRSGDMIVADSPVKMQSIFHQLSSGTLKLSEEKRVIYDESKAWFVKSYFAGKKISIFYLFIAEGELLRKIFPDNTADPEEFNSKDHLTFICQIKSGREGTNLSTADAQVMFNIDFSAISYWQARSRMQTKDRVKSSKLYWIFSERGIERFVHKAVVKKQSYTSSYFKKDLKLIGE